MCPIYTFSSSLFPNSVLNVRYPSPPSLLNSLSLHSLLSFTHGSQRSPYFIPPPPSLTDLSLVTWDPAPQAQPHVVMETAPHARVGPNDTVEAGDVGLRWFRYCRHLRAQTGESVCALMQKVHFKRISSARVMLCWCCVSPQARMYSQYMTRWLTQGLIWQPVHQVQLDAPPPRNNGLSGL